MAFFQKVGFVFQISKSPPKKYSEKLSWTWNLKFPPITVFWYGGKFEFQVQDSLFGIFFGGRFEKWISLFEKKPPLPQHERAYVYESICGKFGDTTLELDSNTFFKVPKQKNPLEHRYLV